MGTLLSLKASFLFSQAVRDSLWQHIYLTPELEETTHTSVFNRLYSIKQLPRKNHKKFIFHGK